VRDEFTFPRIKMISGFVDARLDVSPAKSA
jgi:hypothetical protein